MNRGSLTDDVGVSLGAAEQVLQPVRMGCLRCSAIDQRFLPMIKRWPPQPAQNTQDTSYG